MIDKLSIIFLALRGLEEIARYGPAARCQWDSVKDLMIEYEKETGENHRGLWKRLYEISAE